MGVHKYSAGGRTWWAIDVWLKLPGGRRHRHQQRRIPTREQAQALLAKLTADGFEGKYFDRKKESKLDVAGALELYEVVSKRDNDSWRSDRSRAGHLRRHLGELLGAELTRDHVEQYRSARFAEKTRRKAPPSPASLDREVELLTRALNFCVSCGKLEKNPIAGVPLLRKPNTRSVVLPEDAFEKLLAAAAEAGKDGRAAAQVAAFLCVTLLSYDTGMRKSEVLALRWDQLDLQEGALRLASAETKEERGRVVYLTQRTLAALRVLPRALKSPWLFTNPRTGEHFKDLRGTWKAARAAVGLDAAWFHDLRRSFATLSRKRGTPEAVVMAMGGWRSNAAFRRYNIVDGADLKAAVKRHEKAADQELAEAAKDETAPSAKEKS